MEKEITLKTTAHHVDVEKIVSFIVKQGALYSPFYTATANTKELTIYTNDSKYTFPLNGNKLANDRDKNALQQILTNTNLKGHIMKLGDTVLVKDYKKSRQITEKLLFIVQPNYYVTLINNEKIEVHKLDANTYNITIGIKFFGSAIDTTTAEKLIQQIKKEGLDKFYSSIVPGIPPKYIMRIIITTTDPIVNKVYFTSPGKSAITSIKYDREHVTYEYIPFIEGIYRIKVPLGIQTDIVTPMSINELPPEVEFEKNEEASYPRPKRLQYIFAADDTSYYIGIDDYTIAKENDKYFLQLDERKYTIDKPLAEEIIREGYNKKTIMAITGLLF